LSDNQFVIDGERILIVDDEPTSVRLVRALLTGGGHKVRSAKSAEEALTVLKTFEPQLILLDVQLPGTNGLELASRIRSDPTTHNICIVALTAYAMTGDEQKARKAGCDGYVTKPIDVRTLLSVVNRFLKQKHSQERIASASILKKTTDAPLANGRDSAAALKSAGPVSNDERKRAGAGLPTVAASGDGEDLLSELRNILLAEGRDQIPRLLGDLETEFNVDKARRFFHRWAGIAGTLGYPEITRQARKLDELLTFPLTGSQGTLRAGMEELMACFANVTLASKPDRVWPLEIIACLSGKHFGLMGFSPAETQKITLALAQTHASGHAVVRALPGAGNLAAFDMLVVKISGAGPSPWTDLEQLKNNTKPLLLVGPCETLLESSALSELSADFLTASWDADEVILRAYRVLSKSRANGGTASRRPRGSLPVVVVADDDVAITRLVSATLLKFQIDCRVACDGDRAWQMIKDLRPSALVLDINMPGMDGFDVLAHMREDTHTRNIPVILLTARSQENDVLRGFGYGAADYIIKPFNPTELAARVSRLVV
jgi:two-component system cell cycle response regulator DivK